MYRTRLVAIVATAALAAPIFCASAQTAPAGRGAGPAVKPLTLSSIAPDGKPHKFEARDHQFLIDGQPTILMAGEMHFGRVLPEDFEQRIKQAKAMGLNTLSFYLFWNQVEPKEGKFDFTGTNDVRRMLKLCQENGLWAILRPGPYCCAETEYGGIPYWTLKYPNVPIRTNDATWVGWSKRYIERVAAEVADLQVSRGGPLLMVQMENEYSMTGGSNDYLVSLQNIFKGAGFDCQLFTCDPVLFAPGAGLGRGRRGGAGGFGPGGQRGATTAPATNPAATAPRAAASAPAPAAYPAGILRGRNGLRNENDYQQTVAAVGDFPVYAPEVYTAWFSGWGQPLPTRFAPVATTADWTNFLLDHNASWCYYMFFGGTNWGFSNGCNEYLPVQTSYNYNAPIDEAGRTTEKYRALREILARRTGRELPAIPADPVVAPLAAITFTEKEPLMAWLPEKPTLTSVKPVSMESLDQAYGFVLYRKQFPNGIKGTLELRQAMDYTLVMANGKTIGESFVGLGLDTNKMAIDQSGPVTLDILVYNLGRISVQTNSRSQTRAEKGLIGGAFLDDKELTDWQIYSLPMDRVDNFKAPAAVQSGPTFYRATFHVDSPAGTFLDMRNWGFGAAWVNGHNLGRYWDRGGVRSLYLSPHFLKPGDNEIVVLELHDAPKTAEITGTTTIVESPAVAFPIRLDQARLAPAPAGPARTQ